MYYGLRSRLDSASRVSAGRHGESCSAQRSGGNRGAASRAVLPPRQARPTSRADRAQARRSRGLKGNRPAACRLLNVARRPEPHGDPADCREPRGVAEPVWVSEARYLAELFPGATHAARESVMPAKGWLATGISRPRRVWRQGVSQVTDAQMVSPL